MFRNSAKTKSMNQYIYSKAEKTTENSFFYLAAAVVPNSDKMSVSMAAPRVVSVWVAR